MSWLDKPTKNQISALHHMIQWEVPTAELHDAMEWLENNANRKQVSDELGRIKELKITKRLNRNECFNSPVWAEYFNAKERVA